ncbi:MAG: pseudouridine-5'-phosphate glycosidase [Gemmataceae bacterium]|uniref:Pseudouridine-5'-phosphate glycosidase n=1 Tax=Thermogemmata fonticola TaxID=2755323 RepID=A0A7V8VGE2_9BACT|nr:pseudouridine-5'-phosphate glycosidase [Thermogemmata fonticola]MBA2227476.1 pseudouridine-5'-phosphate glycosidase [Thermogemmata fonticola]MCX8138943.1 pseudouridine-5'-phosphate glycosidase [Gemmataceae bacterium]
MAPARERVQIGANVRAALAARQPVVALESSVFVQGLPSPQREEAAREVLTAIRAAGATPAITAVLGGIPWVGLEDDQLQQLQSAVGVRKAAWRDLAASIAVGQTAATTVSAALALASAVGLNVLATGGIGGVHRRIDTASPSLDVSADLFALTRFPMIVVCSGAKNLLDLPSTWELLESLSIPVVGWQTDRFPAFYVSDAGLPVSCRVDTLAEVSALWTAHRRFAGSGLLLVQPCPEEAAIPAPECERWLEQAEREAHQSGQQGAARTPFVLRRLAELSGGRTLLANRVLLQANARLAAQLAAEIMAPWPAASPESPL